MRCYDLFIDINSYNSFQVEVCVYHGGQSICKRVFSPQAKLTRGFFPTISWNKWLVDTIK